MTESFEYDAEANVKSHTDFRGKVSQYTFDRHYPNGRPTAKIPDPTLGEPSVGYTYYSNGPRQTMTDASGTTTYTYDLRDRLHTKATPEGTLTYTYDPSGNVASIDSSNANGTSVGYAWDAANQLASVTDNRLGGQTTAAYTATGRPASLTQPNGVGVSYGYDSLDRVLSMAWKKGAASPFASWAYTYNDRGQRLSSTELSGREAAYGYDVASRLTSETITGDPSGASGNGALTYNVDPAGNRSSRASTLASLGPQSFSYDANDELTTDSYDPNGNTTSSGGHIYRYDFENRLVSKDGGAVVVVYDGDGNRVSKTAGGVTTKYLVDELNPTSYLQVMDEVSGGAVQVRYTFGNMLISQTRSPTTSPATSFYGYDAHRSIAFLTDSTGAETDTYTYDAWGNLISRVGNTPNDRFFLAEEFDPDLGLMHLRARQYDPATGRFVTSDPRDLLQPVTALPSVEIPGLAQYPYTRAIFELLLSGRLPPERDRLLRPIGTHRYLYAADDPLDRIDPTGLDDAAEDAPSYSAISGSLRAIRWIGGSKRCVLAAIVQVLTCLQEYESNGEIADCAEGAVTLLGFCNAGKF
jgi:RHS repeat-associated protein